MIGQNVAQLLIGSNFKRRSKNQTNSNTTALPPERRQQFVTSLSVSWCGFQVRYFPLIMLLTGSSRP